MATPLPPNCGSTAKNALGLIAPQDREDAIQEAWVAHLEGRSVVDAIRRFGMREARFRKRMIQAPEPSTEV